MSSAGIDISITGNATAFLASLRAAEAATRQVSNAAEAASAREEAAYRRAAAEAAGRARAQVEAARAVQRAEREAAAAAAAAARQGTEAARAEARVKAQALAAARAAAAAAQQQAAAALAAAQAQQRAMGAASRAALDAAEAYRRAADAAAAAAAAAGRGNPPPGGGPPPPPPGGGGGNPPPGGGRGGRGGGGGPPPGGGRRGGLNGNTSGGMDANMAYQIIQDTWQGGFAGVANQIPQLIGLLMKYGKNLGAAGAVIGAGAVAGFAIAKPEEFGDMLGKAGKLVLKFGETLINPTNFLKGVVKGFSGVSAMEESAKKMEDAAKAFAYRQELERAKQRGAATGDNAENLANAARIGAEGRASALDRNLTAREQANELERIRIEGILNEQEQRKAMAEFEKKAAMEQALIRKKAAEEEFAIREREHKVAKQALDELYAQELEAKRGPVTAEKNAKLEELKAARDGVQGRADSAKAALQEAGKGVTEAIAGEQAAAFQAEVEKRRIANEEAARVAEQARQDSIRRFKRFWNDFENAVTTGIENAKTAVAQAAAKKEFSADLEELQLRARGSTRQADKMRKEREIQKSAKDYQAATGATPEQARAYAEQLYDVKNRNGRIRGAGHKTGKESTPAFGIDNPGFSPGRLGVPSSGPASYPGLDALDELQKRNRRIRGAGHKERDPSAGDAAGAAAGAAGNVVGGGVGGAIQVIISKLSSMDSKLNNLSPAKQTRTR